MKRVFLINFSTPILIQVAKNLKARGIEIAYWKGYRSDFDELARTKDGFKNTIFQHNSDAIKNIPPKGVDVSDFEPISPELIKKMYAYGWQALSAITRSDYTNSVFVKRRHMYYSYVKFWQGMLKKLLPDAILFTSIPHSASGFTLYGLAKIFNVKTIILEKLISSGSRSLVMDDYKDSFKRLLTEYSRIKNNVDTLKDLSEDISENYLNQQYMRGSVESRGKQYAHLNTHDNKAPYRIPALSAVIRNFYSFTFFKSVKSYLNMLFSTRKTHYYEKDFTGLQLTLMSRRWGRMSKSFQKKYQKLQIQPDYQKKYVYIPLSFQPEHTTLPMAGIFDDQLLVIDMVASAIPDDWVVYVKEHLPQWYPKHVQAHTYRYDSYYNQIVDKKNVYLIPAETRPKELIQNAQAVATTTGTAGWEALLSGKPSLVFGHVWYMYCDGIFRISNVKECREAIQKIKQGYKVSNQSVIRYLKALENVSVKMKNYKVRGFTEDENVSREENISNITQAFHKALTQ
jgi:hypothetical protein